MGTCSEERREHLAFLRKEFTTWSFALAEIPPLWHAQRDYLDYKDRAAAVTEIRANDPNELAHMLLGVQRLEAEMEGEQ